MTKKTRFILFLSLVILFFIITPLIISYSLGWRFDWKTKKPFKPGVFYFKIQPRGAEVYLDGRLKEKSDFFFNSVFIENLFPQKYKVEIKKEGYHNWEKNLEIKKGEVTEAKNIFLITNDPSFKILSMDNQIDKGFSNSTEGLYSFLKESKLITEKEEITIEEKLKKLNIEIVLENFKEISKSFENFKLSPDSKKIAYFNNYEIGVLFLEKKYDQPQKQAGDKIFLTRFSEKINDLFWLTNHYLIFNVNDAIKIAEIDDRDRINIVDLAIFPKPEIFWDYNNKNLYVLSERNLYVLEGLIP